MAPARAPDGPTRAKRHICRKAGLGFWRSTGARRTRRASGGRSACHSERGRRALSERSRRGSRAVITAGPVFREVTRHGRVWELPLSGKRRGSSSARPWPPASTRGFLCRALAPGRPRHIRDPGGGRARARVRDITERTQAAEARAVLTRAVEQTVESIITALAVRA
jgi:hypothetical protein